MPLSSKISRNIQFRVFVLIWCNLGWQVFTEFLGEDETKTSPNTQHQYITNTANYAFGGKNKQIKSEMGCPGGIQRYNNFDC